MTRKKQKKLKRKFRELAAGVRRRFDALADRVDCQGRDLAAVEERLARLEAAAGKMSGRVALR